MTTVSIAKDFSPTPGGRTDADGPHNGCRFRVKFLDPVVRDEVAHPLSIDLDGVAGLPGSFCDAAFGELIRGYKLSKDKFDLLFHFAGHDPDFSINKRMIDFNVDRALRDINQG